jgi:hypothetical protein
VRDYLEVPICVENVSSYAEFHASEMTEWEFLSEVVERADCGILLDVNNIYVSSKNHAFDPYDYLNNIPHHRVGQMHVAGHTKFEKYILDTHDHPVLDPVWKMYAHAPPVRRHGDAARVGRQDPVVRRGPQRGPEGQRAAVVRPLDADDNLQSKWVDGRRWRRSPPSSSSRTTG